MTAIEFPRFERVRVRIPLRSGDWTIWPDVPQTRRQWFLGHPFEISPMRWDFLEVASDGSRLELKPHYVKSTWDTFWTDEEGCVEVQALGGLFPITLGRQPELIRGIRSVLEKLPDYVKPEHPDVAGKIAWIEQLLFGAECRVCVLSIEDRGPQIPRAPERASMRSRMSSGVWRAKMGKAPLPSAPVTPP
jgi:hypothetical protein